MRCAGRGNKVVFAQFLKDGTSGECRVLAKLPDVTVMAANPVGKFSFRMTDAEKRETADALTRTFDAATGFAVREHARLLVLDEVCAAISCGFLDEKTVVKFLDDQAGNARGRTDRTGSVRSAAGTRGLHYGNENAAAPV